jgi:ABC-type cobalamin/Fe3+-siderophores transport systems, ATPase components
MRPVIETSSLSIGYISGGRKVNKVHESLNLQLFPGQLTGLLGLNGAGKSTLIRTLCGFQPLLKGNIRLMDRDLADYSQSQLARIIGVVLTEKTNTGGISVYELVSLGRHPYTSFLGQLKRHDHQIIEESIAAVGISHKTDHYISELSDGERQKAMIAKVLARQCPVILLDEPTAFLDVTGRIETMSLLRRLAVEQQKTILLSTHDLDLAIRTCDCLWLQQKGYPMLSGTPEDLILSGAFESFFGKDGIVFDQSSGKLNAITSLIPIDIEGDPIITYWVGNALIRNGYQPTAANKSSNTSNYRLLQNDRIHIYCDAINRMRIIQNNDTEMIVESVIELISVIKQKEIKNV